MGLMLIWRCEEKWRKKEIEGLFSLLIYRWAWRGPLDFFTKTHTWELLQGPRWDFINKALGQPHVMDYKGANQSNVKNISPNTTVHSWYGCHSTSINVYRVWGIKVRIPVSRMELRTYIYLDYVKVEILSCIQRRKEKKEC